MSQGNQGVEDRKVVRLCGTQGCCPEVEFKADGGVEIRDDFGGKVLLTADQWSELQTVRKDQTA